MEVVNSSLPSIEFPESDKKYHNSFWRLYEKLVSFGAKCLAQEWKDKDCQDPDKWPYY